MERILCIIGGALNEALEAKILPYDDEMHEIHLFDHICDGEVMPSDMLGVLENLIIEDEEEIPCIFMSDIPNLFELVQGLYQQEFCRFEFLEHTGGKDCLMPDAEFYQMLLYLFKNKAERQDKTPSTRVYVYQGISHVFEPVYGEINSISLDGSSADGRWIYHYPFLQPQITELKEWIEKDDYMNHIDGIEMLFEQIEEQKKQVGIFQFYMFLIVLRNMLLKCDMGTTQCFFVLHGLSYLIKMTDDESTFNLFMQTVINMKGILSGRNLYFVSQQIKRWHLEHPALKGSDALSTIIYQAAYEEYKEKLKEHLQPIPKEERNQDVIVVMTIQFLKEGHAPTRTTLERIYTLGKMMHKKVYVINTREQYSTKGEIPLYRFIKGRVMQEYSQLNQVTWQGFTFDFYQPDCEMPDAEEMKKILLKLRELKPYAVITIGNGSILSDVSANMIPVLNIPVTFSTIPKKENQITIVGRYIPDEEKQNLKKAGYDLDRIVESRFTFSMKEQSTTLTRAELGLPENRFLLGVVGIRLNYEVNLEFFEAMEKTLPKNTHLVFAGKFDRYEEYCRAIPWLAEHSTFVGYQDDIMAFMETIDLYVNPKRLGGGFSIIEAFSKGRPGVTIKYGDVAAAAGDDFCVADYNEMIETIVRYTEDKEFYQSQVEKGKLRAVKMTDSKAALEEILTEAESRKAFF